MAVTYTVPMTIDDNVKAQEILDAFCEAYGFESGNKQAFLKQQVIEFMKQPWMLKKRKLAGRAADISVTIT